MRRTILAAVIIITVALASFFGSMAVAATPSHASTDQDSALVRSCTDYYNHRMWSVMEARCYNTKLFVDHTPEAGQAPTWNGFKSTTNTADVAFPDWKTTIVSLTTQGDRVVMQFVGAGTQTGPLGSLPATGRHVTIMGMRMFRVHDGLITDTWVNYDELGLLQQLGVVPRFSTN